MSWIIIREKDGWSDGGCHRWSGRDELPTVHEYFHFLFWTINFRIVGGTKGCSLPRCIVQHDGCMCDKRGCCPWLHCTFKTNFMHKELIFIFNKHSNINDNINPRGEKVFKMSDCYKWRMEWLIKGVVRLKADGNTVKIKRVFVKSRWWYHWILVAFIKRVWHR